MCKLESSKAKDNKLGTALARTTDREHCPERRPGLDQLSDDSNSRSPKCCGWHFARTRPMQCFEDIVPADIMLQD